MSEPVSPPGVKVFAFLSKRHDLTEEEFHSYWRNPHGELGKLYDMRRYVQSHALKEHIPGIQPARFDGIAEAWFNSDDEARAAGTDRRYLEGQAADEPNFLDMESLDYLYVRECVILDGEVPADLGGVKLIQLVRRRTDLSDVEFAERWPTSIPAADERNLRVQRHVACVHRADLAIAGREGSPFDGVREMWWPSAEALRLARDLGASAWAALRDADLVDVRSTSAMVAAEYRVIWPGREPSTP